MCKAIDNMRERSRLEGKIESLYECGFTVESIAESVGESVERVSEVINSYKEKYGDKEIKACKVIEDMIYKSKWEVKVNNIKICIKKVLV